MHDEFSNFKSAIEWPSFEGEEKPTEELKPIGVAAIDALEAAANSLVVAGVAESPIETFFGARFSIHMRSVCDRAGLTYGFGGEAGDVRLDPQFVLGRFRYDFAVWVTGFGKPVLLVECDGADFHASDEQKKNDAAKDAAAVESGIPLVRYTGSQLFRDADECVSSAIQMILRCLK